MHKSILTVQEAINYQKVTYGRVVFGRDALYKMSRLGQIRVVRHGNRKLLIPITSIDDLMTGKYSAAVMQTSEPLI